MLSGVKRWGAGRIAHDKSGVDHPKWRLAVPARFLGKAYLKSDRIFCEIAEVWASVAVADLALGGRHGVTMQGALVTPCTS